MENYEKAEQDYMSGMKYKDIAEKYGTTINTVKSWKKRYGWNREEGAHKSKKVCTQKGKGAPKVVAPIDDGTKETLRNDELTPEQQMFCIYYSRTFNATQSYLNVYGCSYETAMVEGSKSLRKPKVRAEIERLKEIKRQQIVAGTDDIVELQMRIAFADIGNYMSFGQKEIEDPETGIKYMVSAVDLKESKDTDTQLLQEVKRGKDGVSIKLADRQKAIDWLTMFFEMNPTDKHRKEFDKRKLDLELLKLEMQTRDSAEDAPEQDNFLDALNGSAKEAWSDD
ncbi:MAG: terminase small subunit [Roseburia hominis]|nr:terminase small subunit [Roseburia hominis]